MKTTILSLLAGLLFSFAAKAQGETDNWYFGIFAGLNFSGTSPVALTNSVLYTTEGCSSISDTGGVLLFYTDGVSIYNSSHAIMPNGSGLMGDVSSTQSAIIIKKPQSNSLYYVFTVAADGGPDGLRYSIVDMSLQGGLGDVTATKNVLLQNHVTEKLCAVNAQNDEDVWIMAHGFGDSTFYCYKLAATGLVTTPVISQVGALHDSSLIQNSYGYMKFAPNGGRLALAIGYQNTVQIFNFSNLDGIVSNPITVALADRCYGVEFSPNSKRLYITHYNVGSQTFYLDQFNMLAGSNAAIAASQLNIAITLDPDELRALQLASDGKIYVARSNAGFVDVINYPDSLGTGCTYGQMAVSLGGNTCFLGLPNFNASLLRDIQIPVADLGVSSDTVCAGGCIYYSDSSLNFPTSWQWSFQGGNPASSIAKNPGPICYNTAGGYSVSLIVTNAKGADTLVLTNYITVLPQPATPVITVNGNLLTSSPGASYQWYLNNNPVSGATAQSHTATVSGNYFVVVTYSNGCTAQSDPVNVTVTGIAELEKGRLAIYPNPADDYFYISAEGLKKLSEAYFIDALGRSIPVHIQKQQDRWQVSLAGIAPGCYTLVVTDHEGGNYRGNIIVMK